MTPSGLRSASSPAPASRPVPVLPRLLSGVDGNGRLVSHSAHLAEHGSLPELRRLSGESLIGEIERAGLRGRGGAGFPTARKFRTVAARRGQKHVLVNATEGEPLSRKDRMLLREAPHLVLDGAAVAARAVGADDAVIALTENVRGTTESVTRALAERPAQGREDPRFHVVFAPDRFVTGQETALVSFVNGGPGLPTFGALPFQRGIRGRPTLVQNAETMAHVALIARHGADWYRALGPAGDPGSALLTLGGAIERPGVYEAEHGAALDEILDIAGRAAPLRAVLLGGYFGSWIAADRLSRLRLCAEDLRPLGASLGAGVVFALDECACPVAETARVAQWFARQSAGQCGPCVYGLAAVSDTVPQLAAGRADRPAYVDLRRLSEEIIGRGACRHPDGAMRFITSALNVFAAEFDDHAHHGPCEACSEPALLPTGAPALAV